MAAKAVINFIFLFFVLEKKIIDEIHRNYML